MKIGTILSTGVALVCLSVTSSAADLGYITISSPNHLHDAKQIFNHAFIRNGQRFLVLADELQKKRAVESGLAFEVVLAETAPADACVVYPSLSPDQGVQAKTVVPQGAVDIGDSRYVIRATEPLAAISSRLQTARPLSELWVRFSLEPTLSSVVLTQPTVFPSDSVANRVSRDSVYAFDSRLEAFRTRFFRTDSVDRARDWMVQKFQSWGYTNVTTPEFWVGSYWGTYCNCWRNNVMAIKPGWAEPEQIIVVGAHFDSYSNDAYFNAPGADDNASGTTVVLELARIFKDIPLRKTVVFMPFGAEEIWMYGSGAAAAEFAAVDANVEVMYNFDMVGYNPQGLNTIKLQASPAAIYGDVSAAAAGRLTSILPIRSGINEPSDHTPFVEQGYNAVYVAEGTFNTPNYHRITDSTTKLDFDYMTDIARMAAASLAQVSNAAARTTPIDSIVDQGDGRALEVFWSGCQPDYSYTVYWGTASGQLYDSVLIPPGTCSRRFGNLTEGTRYYFAVLAKVDGIDPALAAPESSEVPRSTPRVPSNLTAESYRSSIRLTWKSNYEADLDHYEVYRRMEIGGNYVSIASTTSTQFTDANLVRWMSYSYRIKAVDHSGLESGVSNEVTGILASMDKGILVADEMTKEYSFMPDQAAQNAYFDTVFARTPHALTVVDSAAFGLQKSLAGQFSSIFWIDDDISNKLLRFSAENLRWYDSLGGNVFICGYSTIVILPPAPIGPGNLLYDNFGLQNYTMNSAKDFAGAKGQVGWPSIQFDSTRGILRMGEIPSLTAQPGAVVIYRYDSKIDDPAREDQPVGVAIDGPSGKRVLLAFPLYYMTPSSATNLISAVKAYFGETGAFALGGDLNADGIVDIEDLVIMIEFLFESLPVPAGKSAADVDASCSVDVGDLSYLLDYLFYSGPAPQAGCVP